MANFLWQDIFPDANPPTLFRLEIDNAEALAKLFLYNRNILNKKLISFITYH